MKLQDKLGQFAQLGSQFAILDQDGNDVTAQGVIQAGIHTVVGDWKLVTKDQIARVVGIVTPSMTNAEKDGLPVFEFQGNGWRPQASPGDVLLQDVSNPNDQWACQPEIFQEDSGWKGTVQEDGSVTYAKPGKPLLSLELPEGITVISLEGSRDPIEKGGLLSCAKADRGDFYLWSKDVVEAYVKPYSA